MQDVPVGDNVGCWVMHSAKIHKGKRLRVNHGNHTPFWSDEFDIFYRLSWHKIDLFSFDTFCAGLCPHCDAMFNILLKAKI